MSHIKAFISLYSAPIITVFILSLILSSFIAVESGLVRGILFGISMIIFIVLCFYISFIKNIKRNGKNPFS